MTFLAPLAWSLFALAVPVVALYLIKTRLRRRPVTTLLFWEQLRPPAYNHSLWRKLRRWLSLSLQILFLALLAFALARPLAHWETAGARATVLVLNPSPSMLATDVAPDRWTAALRAARQHVDAMRFSDGCALILADQPPQVLSSWTDRRRTLADALDTVRDAPAHTHGDGIRETLALARRLAEGRAGARVVLLSDGAWNEPPAAAELAGVEWRRFGTDTPVNTALTAFSARRSLVAPGDYLAAAEVHHFGTGPVDGELEVRRDGRILDLQPLHLEPDKPWRKTWRGHADGAAHFEARWRSSAPDQLAADDTAEARLAAVVPARIDLVAPPNGFLDAALNALPAAQWRRVAAAELDASQPATLTVFYRANPPEGFPAGAAALLIDPPGGGFWGEPAGSLENALVSDSERDSVPMRFVGLESVSLQGAREFRPAPGSEIFAQSFGKPLVFGHWPAGGDGGPANRRWLLLPFDLENTDFVLRTAFPILLGNLVQSLRIEPPVTTKILPGEVKSRLARTVTPPPENGPSAPSAVAVAWWAWAPLWWWAVAAGVVWLLTEWWLFSRRITE